MGVESLKFLDLFRDLFVLPPLDLSYFPLKLRMLAVPLVMLLLLLSGLVGLALLLLGLVELGLLGLLVHDFRLGAAIDCFLTNGRYPDEAAVCLKET